MAGPQKILFVIDQFINPYAGTESQLFQLIKHLPRDYFEPELLVLQNSEFTESGQMPCPVHVLGIHRLVSPRTWLALYWFARERHRDGVGLAHVFFNDASILCPPVFRLCNIKTIISRRDMGYWYTRSYLAILRLTGKLVSRVIVNSAAVQQVTHLREKISKSRIDVIYNGYEEASLSHDFKTVPELRRLRESETGPLVVIVANVRPIKRIDDAVRAIASLQSDGVAINLVVIGGGDHGSLQTLAGGLGVQGRVHFLGPRRDIRDCLQYMDIGLLCSESEGYSNAIVEYMKESLPVVASDVGGNTEAVTNGLTGLLYPMGQVDRLARHLRHLVENQEERRLMGKKGREVASKRHTLSAMVDAHVHVYQQMLSDPTIKKKE